MARLGLVCLGLIAVLAGCGGPAGLYTLAATRACLDRDGFKAVALTNRSLPGSGGNLRVQLRSVQSPLSPTALRGSVAPNEFVFLVFDKDSGSALATEDRAITLTVRTLEAQGEQLTRAYVRAGVGLSKNVFYYSPSGPLSKTERSKVESCLR